MRSQLLARYQQLYGALESRHAATAAKNLAFDYAEHQTENKPLNRTEWQSKWQKWLESRPSVGPIYVSIENIEQNGALNITTTVLIVIVATVQGKNGETNQEVVDELRRDTWTRVSKIWMLKRSEMLLPAVSGEIIPGADEPESRRLMALVEHLRTGDQRAVAAFWQELDGSAPLVEPIPGDGEHRLVNFVWRHSPEIESVGLFGNLPFAPSGNRLLMRLPGKDIWYRSLRVPANTRTTYGFDVYRKFSVPDKGKTSRSVPFILSIPILAIRVFLMKAPCLIFQIPHRSRMQSSVSMCLKER